jgi:drug/metabolite transporter superfamily protein YnfA
MGWRFFLEEPMSSLSPTLIAAVLAGLLSLAATLVPGFRTWFAQFTAEKKQAIMAIASILIAVAVYFLACTPELAFPFVMCPTGGVWELLAIVFAAVVSNQGIDRATPEPEDVKAIKANQKRFGA